MKVPSAPAQGRQRPQVDEVFVAMAAADLHDAGLLFEPPIDQGLRPNANLHESRPHASMGGRSMIEQNNPELGPTEPELRERQNEFRREHERRVKGRR